LIIVIIIAPAKDGASSLYLFSTNLTTLPRPTTTNNTPSSVFRRRVRKSHGDKREEMKR
jgi:hypothetical protein